MAENVDVVRSVYEAWSQGDFSGGDVFDPEVEFEMPDWPEAVHSHGLEGMRQAWQEALGAWDGFRAEAEEFIEVDANVVVVLTRAHGRGKGSGADVVADTACVWTLEAGKVTKLSLYWDSARALEAAGKRF